MPATLLGLPCEKCHTYYAADVTQCPRCNAKRSHFDFIEQVTNALAQDESEVGLLIYRAMWQTPPDAPAAQAYKNAARAVLEDLRRRVGLTEQK